MSSMTKSRPQKANNKGLSARTREARAFAAKLAPVIAEIRASGIVTSRKIAVELNDRNVRAARGGIWGSWQVLSLLKWIDIEIGEAE